MSETGYSCGANNPMLFTDPFGLDTLNANANKPVNQGDVIVFDNGTSARQNVGEATVKGARASQSEVITLLPTLFAPVFRPGPTPITLPNLAPLAIPVAYNTLDTYLQSLSAIKDIAQVLERFGVPNDVLRGKGIVNSKPTPDTHKEEFKRLPGNQGWINKRTGEVYKKSHTSHKNPGNVGVQWKVWPKGTTDFGSTSKKTGQRTTLDGKGNIIGN